MQVRGACANFSSPRASMTYSRRIRGVKQQSVFLHHEGLSMTSASTFSIQAVQKRRKIAALASGFVIVVFAMFTQSLDGIHAFWHEVVEWTGRVAIAVAIIGRAWCSLYIGGRKKEEIVDRGPYSVTRNPLYMFSFIGAFGVGAQAGSLVIAVLFVIAAVVVFTATVEREEAWLSNHFGEAYRAYRARTPRFMPRLSLWQDSGELVVRPAFFLLTLRDGLVFLLAIPLFEFIDLCQAQGWLPVLIRLP
jgi:protein-S-isoprenylcysteine O-methyltransferase Ste14